MEEEQKVGSWGRPGEGGGGGGGGKAVVHRAS